MPRPRWGTADASVVGAPFFLMDRIEGEALPRRLLRDDAYAAARIGMAPVLGAIAARIHALDLSQPELAALPRPPADRSIARTEVERVVAAIGQLAVEPHPVLDLAERWLLERAPEPPRLALVHGDYRIGNVIFDNVGVAGNIPFAAAYALVPIAIMAVYLYLAKRAGAFEAL